MPTPAESATLLLKLYELRTEETLRRARAWFAFDFHPRSAEEVLAAWLGPGNETGPYRMATTYWDMACSLVVHRAIDAAMFHAANTEHVGCYVKLRPFLGDVRARSGYPDYLGNLERVVETMPDADAHMAVFGRYVERQAKLAAKARSGG